MPHTAIVAHAMAAIMAPYLHQRSMLRMRWLRFSSVSVSVGCGVFGG